MLNRRHIRIKVMQTIYAMHQTGSDNLEKEEKFLVASTENILDLYLILLSSLVELRNKEEEFLDISSKKFLATAQEKNPNRNFVDNSVLKLLAENQSLLDGLETKKITNWKRNDDTILLLLQDIKQSSVYINYMQSKPSGFEADKKFITKLFEEVIAPNEKVYNYIEDQKLTWVDDLPVVNTQILKDLKSLSQDTVFRIPKLFKDIEDRDFAINLFRKTVLNEQDFVKEYNNKTKNWDVERVAEMDTIILKMAICEFLKFPSIPVKVTINEYVEISKEYSTPRSSNFINGILDNLVKEFQENDRLKKAGRGLMQ